MTTNDNASVGVYDDLTKAEQTIDELRAAGFRQEEIGIVGHVDEKTTAPLPSTVRAPETTAVTGFVSGSFVGMAIGALVAIVIPGLGAVSGLGRWFEILGGAILGAAAGGVMLAYGGLLITRTRDRFFRRQLDRGRFIVTVNNPQRRAEAMALLSSRKLWPSR